MLEQTTLNLEWDQDARIFLEARLADLTAAGAELDPGPGHAAPLKWTDEWQRQPMPHQVQAIRAIGHMRYRVLLGDDMGLGKSATAIWAWQQTGAPRLLVICPNTVKHNWRKELWSTLKEVSVHLVDGTPKQRADAFGVIRHVLELVTETGAGERAAIIINYDLLHRLAEPEVKVLAAWCAKQFLVCDESHYIKNRKAGRTEFVLEHLAPKHGGAHGRLMLTGTPIRNTSEDLWAQIQAVRPGTWASFHQFDKMHLARSKMDVPYTTKTGKQRKKAIFPVRGIVNREQLNAIVNTLQIRRRKEDVLDLPPKIFTYPELELDPPTAKIYAKMRDFALIEIAELGDDTPIFAPGAKSALEATLRLEQLAQGFLGGIPEPYLEKITPLIAKSAEKIDGRPGHLIFPRSTKIEWLCETIDTVLRQGGQPFIITRFNTPAFWLEQQWEDSCFLHGGLSAQVRTDMIEAFQAGGKRIMFAQVKLCEGFNLTRSNDGLFYGRDWSPAVNSQAGDRMHRIGQTGTVNIQVPIMLDTFEVYLHKKLTAKERDAEQSLRRVTVGELRKAL